MARNGESCGSVDSAAATSLMKGFRFRASGKTVDWSEEMESTSPFLAAMARKVKDPEGSSVEVDESGYVLVDDSSYSPKVMNVLVAALQRKKRRLDLDQLEVEDLLEYLKCADFYQLPYRCNHQVCVALWTKISSRPVQSTSVLRFEQVQFKEPLLLDSMTLQGLICEELVLHNVGVKENVSLTDVVFADSSLLLGLGGELTATQTVFKNSKLNVVCKQAMFESCSFQDTKWEGPSRPRITIKHGALIQTHLPEATSLTLEEVSLTDCELQSVAHLWLVESSLTRTQLPPCGCLELTEVDLCSTLLQCSVLKVTNGSLRSISVRCRSSPLWPADDAFDEAFAVLVQADAEKLDLHAAQISLQGVTRFKECRLREDERWEGVGPTPIMANGCVFRGMTFLIGTEPLSFKDCSFYRCIFQRDSCGSQCILFDNCALIACSTQRRYGHVGFGYTTTRNITDVVSVRFDLGGHFHSPCQVVADIPEIPEGLAAAHLEWISAE